jgi:hydroxyacylglutathione hydrolase
VRQPIALVTPVGLAGETVLRLARVGYDQVVGYLDGGFAAWQVAGKETDYIESITADEFAQRKQVDPALTVADVRKPTEFAAEHVAGAKNLPLDTLNEHLADIDRTTPTYLHCAGGYRSMVAASILKARGFDQIVNIEGGIGAIQNTGLTLVNE